MQYLKGCLTGKVAEVIAKIKMTTEGYSSTWIQLLKDYDIRDY
jgi:hypothetical protein